MKLSWWVKSTTANRSAVVLFRMKTLQQKKTIYWSKYWNESHFRRWRSYVLVKYYEDIFLRNNVQWWTIHNKTETYYQNVCVKRRKQTHSPSCVFKHFCGLHLQLYLTVHLTPLSPASPSAHPFSHPILLALARFPLHTLSAWPSSARHFQPAPKT